MKEGASRSVLRGIIQNDTLNEVNIRLTDGSKAFDYTGYTNIVFKVLKADGTSYIDSEGENVIATAPMDGIVTVYLKGQATTAAGLCQSVIEIYNVDDKMTTARLNYEVFEELGTGEATESTSQYPVFQNLMADLGALEASIEVAEAKRVAAENARVALETGYVARAEKAAKTAEMWVRASQDMDEGDYATRAELEAVENGAAPAGYGLGASSTKRLDNIDLDSVFDGGTYAIAIGCTNLPPNTDTAWSKLVVIPGRACTQFFVPANDANLAEHCKCFAVRIYSEVEKKWQPWEWVNPTMISGVEYRTTERYEGKPVYVQRVNLGTLHASGTKAYYFSAKDTSAIRVVRTNIVAKQVTVAREVTHTLPLINGSTGVIMATADVVSRLDGGDRPVVNVSVMVDCSAYTCTAEIWYTKDTDT